MPAHVTVLFPFRAPEALDDATLHKVAEVAALVPPFESEFAEPAEWPGVVWLRPTPDEGFRALTREAVARFPEHPPYDGAHPETIPHLTVGQALEPEEAREVVAGLRAGLRGQPIRCAVDAVTLWASDEAGHWRRWHRWVLGGR